MKMKLTFLILLCFAGACRNVTVTNNDEKDIKKAKEFAIKFYTLIDKTNFNQVSLLFDTATISKVDAIKLLEKINSIQGHYMQCDLTKIETNTTVENSTKEVKYIMEFNITYQNGVAKEDMTIRNNSLDSLCITGYHSELR
jgi:hypothetical protein